MIFSKPIFTHINSTTVNLYLACNLFCANLKSKMTKWSSPSDEEFLMCLFFIYCLNQMNCIGYLEHLVWRLATLVTALIHTLYSHWGLITNRCSVYSVLYQFQYQLNSVHHIITVIFYINVEKMHYSWGFF